MSKDRGKRPEVEDDDRKTLGERLREAREYLGFSQDQVATFLGVPRSALSLMEAGRRKVDALELKKLAGLYKRPSGYFTGEEVEDISFGADLKHLTRKVSELSPDDREELGRFADFLRVRKETRRTEMRSGLDVNATAGSEDEFRALFEEWRRDTATSSSMRTKASHPAYRRIVAMGEPAIPLILAQLRRQPSHIFWALHEITGVNPVQPGSAGKVREMVEDWLTWGALQGYEA
jgi:transcriptional regulator with XRE-family HTH domain